MPPRDSVSRSDLTVETGGGANPADLLVCQLGATVALATWLTPLAISVGHVVGMCAEEKMVLANARWLIAAVEDMQPVRDRAVRLLPGDVVCATLAPVLPSPSVPAAAVFARRNVTGRLVAPIFHAEASLAPMMAADKARGLTLHMAYGCPIPRRNRSWLATAALAEPYSFSHCNRRG